MGHGDNYRREAASTRVLRVGENIRHILSEMLARGEVQDPELDGTSITVTEVRISPDLRNATAFVMKLGGDPDGRVVGALNRHSRYIRGLVGKRVRMKYTPSLTFKLDLSYDEASSIDSLLKRDTVRRDLEGDD